MSKRRKNNVVKKKTLDQRHTDEITKFNIQQNSLPTKKNKLNKLKKELNAFNDINSNKYTLSDIHRKSYISAKINTLENEIESIEKCTDKLGYIVNVLPYLINYYDNNKCVDDEMEDIDIYTKVQNDNVEQKNILSYFNIETNKLSNNKNITNKFSTNKPKISRSKIYNNYINMVDKNFDKTNQTVDLCCSIDGCDGEKFLNQNSGDLICKKCGLSEHIYLATDKPKFKESQDSGAYKRINHLAEILSQLQAKESTEIHPIIFENINKHISKKKINKNDIDFFKMRQILKILGYRKYYEHVPHILQVISGKPPPKFSRDAEAKIKRMFKDIQKPFSIYCPPNRKNFLNYSYFLHKACELLGLDEYVDYFPLLKNIDKLRQHDKIWKNICCYLKWEYHPSI